MFDPLLVPILINKLGKKMNILDQESLKELKISKLHILYLIALSKHKEGYTLKELSDYLGYDKANTSRAINHLLKIGYAEKELRENMQLKYKVVLTKEGHKVAKDIFNKEIKKNADMFMLFTKEEMTVLQSVITKLVTYLD